MLRAADHTLNCLYLWTAQSALGNISSMCKAGAVCSVVASSHLLDQVRFKILKLLLFSGFQNAYSALHLFFHPLWLCSGLLGSFILSSPVCALWWYWFVLSYQRLCHTSAWHIFQTHGTKVASLGRVPINNPSLLPCACRTAGFRLLGRERYEWPKSVLIPATIYD
jgi:hypothetical protein